MITELNKIVVIARASQDRAYAELRQSRNLVQAMLDGEFTGSAQERKILILLAGVVETELCFGEIDPSSSSSLDDGSSRKSKASEDSSDDPDEPED